METQSNWLTIELIVVWWLICGIVASLIGSKKGRAALGFFLGFLFGPIGVVVILFLKGNRIDCPHCVERIHKDAWICPNCRTEIGTHYELISKGYGEVRAGNSTAVKVTAALIIAIIFGAGVVVLISLESYGVAGTGASKSATSSKQGVRRSVTRSQFARLRNNMSYHEVVDILGFRGERTTEIKLSDSLSLVTFRWQNTDGSMVIIDFKKIVGVNEDWGLLTDSISSIGLTE